jgi:hypothetical protein
MMDLRIVTLKYNFDIVLNNNLLKRFKDILFKNYMYKNTGMDNEFKKIVYTRREKKHKRNNNHYKNNLFSSNVRPYIMMANGIQTTVAKGSNNEWMFWSVKDGQGNNYYFDSPKDAERVFDTEYPSYLKQKWHERVTQMRNFDNDNKNEE